MVEESLLPLMRAAGRSNCSLDSTEKAPTPSAHMLDNLEEASSNDDGSGVPASLSCGLGGCDDVGARGLGAHGFQDATLQQDLNNSVDEREVGDQEAGGHHVADFCSGMFKELPAPLLPTPKSPPPHATLPRAGKVRKRKNLQATRSSLRQAAKPSTVPVAERAQHKLMRELEFLNPRRPAPDAAVTAYIDLYGDGLPEAAIKALRKAARLDNKELAEALAAIVDESDVVDMEA